jgi:hypothetical protein
VAKTFKDDRINRDIVQKRKQERTQKHQNYGSKERKTLNSIKSGMYREE